jgi:hypothetical protein
MDLGWYGTPLDGPGASGRGGPNARGWACGGAAVLVLALGATLVGVGGTAIDRDGIGSLALVLYVRATDQLSPPPKYVAHHIHPPAI